MGCEAVPDVTATPRTVIVEVLTAVVGVRVMEVTELATFSV